MQNYYTRKNYIFNNRNKISKEIYKGWLKLDIDINIKNNKFYREKFKNDSLKAIFLEGIMQKNYNIGCLYYKIKRLKIRR